MMQSARALLGFAFFVATCLWLPGPVQAGAPPAKGAGGWHVLVVDQVSPRTRDAGARWVTVWSDGNLSGRVEAPVVNLGGKLYTLKVTTTRKREACSEGKFPFTYEIDQLVAEPLGGGEPVVLLGASGLNAAKDIMREHLSSCEGMKPLPFAPDSTESYEKFKIRLLSVYGDTLGVETVTESFAYGRPKAMVSNDWACYQLKGAELVKLGKKVLPPGAVTEATSSFVKLPPAEREGYAPADFSHFALVPAGGGLAVEFGVPATQEQALGTVRVVRVVKPAGLADDYNKARQAFVASHPKLVAWDKVSFYTIAPDRQAVVYAADGKLFWQAVKGKPRLLGQVKEVRGWQWTDGRLLTAGQRKALGLK
jgi:hypothetical protein